MDLITIVGTVGSLLILVAFGMNQVHKWKNDYLIYDLTNVVGSILLISYAILIGSLPFLILNLVWLSMSIRDVFVDFDRNKKRPRADFFNKWLK